MAPINSNIPAKNVISMKKNLTDAEDVVNYFIGVVTLIGFCIGVLFAGVIGLIIWAMLA